MSGAEVPEYRFAINIEDWMKLHDADTDCYIMVYTALCMHVVRPDNEPESGAMLFLCRQERCEEIIQLIRLKYTAAQVRFYKGQVGTKAWERI